MAVPEQQRSPRSDVVDVLVPIDVPNVRPLAARDEGRRAANAAERPDGRVDAARNDLLGAPEERFRFRMVHVRSKIYARALPGTIRLKPRLIPISYRLPFRFCSRRFFSPRYS